MDTLALELDQLCDFVNEYDWLIQAHGARFFTKGYERLVPKDWLDALMQLSETSLYLLPCLYEMVFDTTGIVPPDSLLVFLRKCKSFALPSTPEANALSLLSLPPFDGSDTAIPPLSQSPFRTVLTKGMSPKKRHEVELLADLIYRVSLQHGCRSVLDLGCGQGYLMQVLGFYYKLDVLGVDSLPLQTNGVVRRAQQTQLLLQGLFRKNPHLDASKLDLTPVLTTLVCPIDTNITMSQLSDLASTSLEVPYSTDPATSSRYPKKYQPIPFRCPAIHPLLSDNGVILVGLHTCGDLAPTTLRLFHESRTVKAMINVGCCYNLMTESECPSRSEARTVSTPSYVAPTGTIVPGNSINLERHLTGYPLSHICKEKVPKLTRAARVLACQSVWKRPAHARTSLSQNPSRDTSAATLECLESMISQFPIEERVDEEGDAETSLPIHLVHRAQAFRAVLQVVYEEVYGSHNNNYSGQYSRDYLQEFPTYCAHLLNRQNFPPKLTEAEMEAKWQEIGVPAYHKLAAFDNLRVCFSQVLENLIMKDRLLFLQEQNKRTGMHCQHVLFPIFDASISPRNMAFLSSKLEVPRNE